MKELLEKFNQKSLELCMLCETFNMLNDGMFNNLNDSAQDASSALVMPIQMLNRVQKDISICCDELYSFVSRSGGDAE